MLAEAAKHFVAFAKCTPEIQAGVLEMFEIVNDPTTSETDKAMSLATIEEALRPTEPVNLVEYKIAMLQPDVKVRIKNFLTNPDSSPRICGKEAVILRTIYGDEKYGYSYYAICEGERITLWYADIESVVV